jgi:hypothetical protein
MTLPRIENETDFVAQPHLLVDKDGEKLCLIVKATLEHEPGPPRGADGTFSVAPRFRRRTIRPADVPWGKPEVPSIRYPSDLCVRKPGTDVIVVARAFAPRREAVARFDCGVRLGKVSKVVRVTGPRVWAGGGEAVTEPRPLEALDVRYDYAFGGLDDSDPEKPVEDARNPVGLGIARDGASLEGAAAPQLEDPTDPVKTASSRPKPAGLGAIGRNYKPRRERFGTYDADWLENRCPLPPPDFDDRANLAATPELVATPPLVGGEEGALSNLTPDAGTLAFVLPRVRLAVTFRVPGREPETFRPYLDTVVLDTLGPIEHRQLYAADPEFPPPPDGPLTVELVWRASVVAPRRIADATVFVREERSR